MTTGWVKGNGINGLLKEGGASGKCVRWNPQDGTGDEDETRFPIEERAVEEDRRRKIKVIVCEEETLIGRRSRRYFGLGKA